MPTGNVSSSVPSLASNFETLPLPVFATQMFFPSKAISLGPSVQGKICNPDVLSVESSAECVARQIDGCTVGPDKIPAQHSNQFWIELRPGQAASSGCAGVALITFVALIALSAGGAGSSGQSL